MIQLELPPKPEALNDVLIEELTEQYKKEGTAVWKKDFLVDAVSEIAFGKCCYSECRLGEEGKYVELDHFYPKKYFPDRVVEWGNLVPSNKKCNTTKGDHNPEIEPIINPFESPKPHLYIANYRFYPKTEIGRATIETVALNDRQHFLNKRSAIGNKVSEILNDIYDEINDNGAVLINAPHRKRKLIRNLKSLMDEAGRKNIYSATISTVILTDEFYPKIEQFFIENNLWDDEFVGLKDELIFCSLLK